MCPKTGVTKSAVVANAILSVLSELPEEVPSISGKRLRPVVAGRARQRPNRPNP